MSGKKAQTIKKIIVSTSSILNYIGMGMLLVLMLIGAGDVIGRYFFRRPIVGTLEISEILMAGLVFFSWAYTQLADGHVKVTAFQSRLPPRAQAIAGFLTSSLLLVLFGMVAWQGTKWAIVYWKANRLIDVIRLPIAPFQLFVPLGALALCLVLIMQMLRFLSKMR